MLCNRCVILLRHAYEDARLPEGDNNTATESIIAEFIIIPAPVRLAAVGAFAGGALLLLLLLSAALPTHAHALDRHRGHGHEQARSLNTDCDGATPCPAIKEASPRRKPLKASTRRECARLGAAIRDNEQAEQRSGARGVMESLQQDAHGLRRRYRELGCQDALKP